MDTGVFVAFGAKLTVTPEFTVSEPYCRIPFGGSGTTVFTL